MSRLLRVGVGPAAGDLAEDDLVEHRARGDHLAPGRARARAAGAAGSRSRRSRARARSARPRRRPCRPRRGRGRAAPASRSASPGCASSRRRRRPRRGAGARSPARPRPPSPRPSAVDLLAVEGGHHDRPGAVVVVVVDRQQAVAEQRDQVAEARLAPVEVLRVGDGDEVVGLRPEHEDDLGVEQAQAEDRPVLFVVGEQQRQRVVGDLVGAGEAEVARARAGSLPRPRHSAREVVGHPAHRVVATSAAAWRRGRRSRPASPDPSWLTGQAELGRPWSHGRQSRQRGAQARLAASWPQAASMSRPRVRRTVAVRRCSARIARKRSIRSGEEPS